MPGGRSMRVGDIAGLQLLGASRERERPECAASSPVAHSGRLRSRLARAIALVSSNGREFLHEAGVFGLDGLGGGEAPVPGGAAFFADLAGDDLEFGLGAGERALGDAAGER